MKILSVNSHSISLTLVRKVHDLDHMVFNRIQVKQERKTSKVKEMWEQKGPNPSGVLSEVHPYSTTNIYVEAFLYTIFLSYKDVSNKIFLMQWTYLRPKHI